MIYDDEYDTTHMTTPTLGDLLDALQRVAERRGRELPVLVTLFSGDDEVTGEPARVSLEENHADETLFVRLEGEKPTAWELGGEDPE
ncbi:hypothetical protein DAETH_28700 [Deinococcus aetherius]|uniref:Uncharacterized protein n=1 Tax=Deinococcus aetherius TaxID=200252 RepID=A0ABM8AGI7_9DEIO|nr:hypothetical protein [Deinococcus aetherius]BDP42901.1 hypothetical protein DAETH_28700 [Deinococcus aetherius]